MNADSTVEPRPARANASLHRIPRWAAIAIPVLVVLLVGAGFAALYWVRTLPDRVDDQQTIVVGQTRFVPDSDASVRVVVQDFVVGQPVAGATVEVSLKPEVGRSIPLYKGVTDASGSLPVRFHVPADAPREAHLVVETRSPTGRDRVEQPVTIQRDFRLLLTSDKPLYQPGQTIHMRALALSTLDLTPARGVAVDFLVEDPKSNKVWRKQVAASEYGIAAADFALADLVNQGNYKVSVAIGDTRSEKTVEVRPYVLPKFGVTVSTDRSYYLPSQRVEGTVQADYFFGKPVAEGEVRIVGTVWDVERTVVVDLQGQTDAQGTYAFAFDLPDYFAGSGLDSGQAQFALEVTVVDQTDHPEQTSQVLPIAAQPLIIEGVAESGTLVPGVENVVYLLTAYPDGRPALTQMTVRVNEGEPLVLESGDHGLATFRFTPQPGIEHRLDVRAQDPAGTRARRVLSLASAPGADSVLLRADRAAYVVGETMRLLALTPVRSGDIYLDIVKAGQTLSTRSAPVADGAAEFAVDVSPDLYGTLELHAYKVLLDGTIVRDTRLVVVDAPNELAIDVTPGQDTYLPGDLAQIDVQVAGAHEDPAPGLQAALGVAVVDESVFALQRQDPGFAKLYFLLEQELMEPFYQIGAPFPSLLKTWETPASIPADQQALRIAQDAAAKATWAAAPGTTAGQPLHSRPLKLQAVQEAQREGYTRVGKFAALGLVLVPVLALIVALVAVWQGGVLGRSLARLALAVAILVLIAGCLVGWLIVASELFYRFDVEEALLPVVVLLALGVVAVLIYAWVKRDWVAGFLALLVLVWGALLFLLIRTADLGPSPDETLVVAMLLTYPLIPAAYLLFGQGRWLKAERLPGALSIGVGALSFLPVLAIVPALILLPNIGAMGAMAPGDAAFFGDGAVVRRAGEVLEMAVPAAATKQVVLEAETVALDEDAAPGEAPRLRQYFPETLYWAPEVLTDEDGYVSLEIPMADSITTWRLTALASSQDGRLGFTTRGIRVFQDFFVDVDLPVSLTQGDEISIPVGVFNYLPRDQEVRLVVEPEPWFELLGPGERTLTIASNDIDVVYFPIRVAAFGQQGFQVTAWGEEMSDAIRREVRVLPDGAEMRLTESNWLREPREFVLDIPVDAVPGTARAEVKIYPGVMAQAVEGLEKILRLPHG